MMGQTKHILLLIVCLSLAVQVQATPVFIQNASQETIEDVLYPYVQNDAGYCCCCWQTAMGTIFAYWDDYTFNDQGPWESLILPGNGHPDDDVFSGGFMNMTIELDELASDPCNDCGAIPSEIMDAARAYNDQIGYSFDFDPDTLVWWGQDLTDEIDTHKPVYLAAKPWDGDSSIYHAITVVGYDDESDRIIYVYDNQHAYLTTRMWDEFDDIRTINITPGGKPSTPSEWTCDSTDYENFYECNCACGTYDPDCDDSSLAVTGCSPTERCDSYGICKNNCPVLCYQAGISCGDYIGCDCGTCQQGECCIAGQCTSDCQAADDPCPNNDCHDNHSSSGCNKIVPTKDFSWTAILLMLLSAVWYSYRRQNKRT
jgi:hypothetical protein